MQDAIALANWIATLESKAVGELDTIFKEYYSERYPIAKDTFARSQMFNKVLGKVNYSITSNKSDACYIILQPTSHLFPQKQNIQAWLTRIVMRRIPSWLRRKILIKATETRPQVSFLPLVKDKGSVKPVYQASLSKTLAIMEKRAAVRGYDSTNVNAASPV